MATEQRGKPDVFHCMAGFVSACVDAAAAVVSVCCGVRCGCREGVGALFALEAATARTGSTNDVGNDLQLVQLVEKRSLKHTLSGPDII